MAENTKTLIRWLIDQIDGKAYRAGKASGKRHPDVDRELLETVGGLKSLVTQARELEQDVCLGGTGKIQFDWRDMNTDIKRIHFSVDIMPNLCKREGTEDPRERQLRYIGVLENWERRAGDTWLSNYYKDELRKLYQGDCSLTIQKHIEDGHLYRCLDEILHLEEPAEKPIFSARLFKNVRLPGEKIPPSKIFRKKYESAVFHILKKYSPEYEEEMGMDELFTAHGILTYAQTLEWKGDLSYVLDTGEEIASAQNIYGTILNAQTMEHAVPKSLSGVRRVFIIENKANYEKKRFQRGELYIFCHGFFSPKEVRFLKGITAVAEAGTKYYHWGDMDYGGIRIFQFNKANVFPELIPFRMDRKAYMEAISAGAGVPIKEDKREKLEHMDAEELKELKKCILEYGLEIEQELLAE